MAKGITPKTADATVEELEEQLAAARRIHDEDLALVAQAEEHFDRVGTDKAAAELESAQAEANRSRLHVERAERLLAAAHERQREATRAALERERGELLASLSAERVRARVAPLAATEAQALLAFAEARLERLELRRELDRDVARLETVMRELGLPTLPEVGERGMIREVDEEGREHVRMAPPPENHLARQAVSLASGDAVLVTAVAALDLAADDPRRGVLAGFLTEGRR